MIFPQNVHKMIQDKSRISGDNKIQLITVLFTVGNFLCFFLLQFIMSFIAPGTSLKVIIGIQLVIVMIVSVFVFRFVIFDENSKKLEYKGQQSDSFIRYMNLRKDNITKMQDGVNVFEYTDGTSMFAVELRFGSNDDSKAAGTAEFYSNFMKIIALYGFESRCIVGSEDFSTSSEFQHHLDLINSIEDVEMRRTMLLMTDTIVEESQKSSHVDCVYIFVRSTYNYQNAELDQLLRSFIKQIGESYTAFRQIKFLEFNDMIELFRYFYGIDVVDLSSMKAISLASDIHENFNNVIKILSLSGESGKVYSTKNINSLVSVKEKQIN